MREVPERLENTALTGIPETMARRVLAAAKFPHNFTTVAERTRRASTRDGRRSQLSPSKQDGYRADQRAANQTAQKRTENRVE